MGEFSFPRLTVVPLSNLFLEFTTDYTSISRVSTGTLLSLSLGYEHLTMDSLSLLLNGAKSLINKSLSTSGLEVTSKSWDVSSVKLLVSQSWL